MTSARLQQIDEIFQAAVTQAPADRDAFLETTCGGDVSLRASVADLLTADGESDEFADIARDVAADWVAKNDQPDFSGHTLGRYRLIERLGAGGMGEVFLAEDLTLHRKAALKLLPQKFTRNADRLRRFEQEARAASALNHPNIITIHEVGQADGTHFIAAEYVDGETLNDKMQSARLPLHEVLEIGCQAAGALAAAHAANIVHRDIKPANIMVRRDGYIKVLDFGIAKLASTATPQLEMTQPGRVLGTVNYMSPEQALGKPLDQRSDIFSLGVVLYEIATATRLFAADSDAATYDRILNREPPPLRETDPSLPNEFELVLRRALEKDPERRYQSAADLRVDLRRLASGNEVTEAAKLARIRKTAQLRSRRLRLGALAALMLLLAATLFFVGQQTGSSGNAPARGKISRQSIAVLPFENANGTPEGATFTDGVHDQVLNDLRKVSGLRVISRTSAMQYEAGAPRDLHEISEQLRVGYIVEGSVQRMGEKVRVSVRLRDTMRGTQVWTETYEREVADVFAIQSEIAQAVAQQLRTTISPAEKAHIDLKPTRDVSAFTLYARGKELIEEARTGSNSESNFKAGAELLKEAVARDPHFFVAYCELAAAEAKTVLYGIDNTTARLAVAQTAVDEARRISPDSGDTHLAAARVFYAGLQYERAGEELEVARRVLPKDPRIVETSAFIHRRLGRWLESTAELERALELDPLNADLLQDISSNYEGLHHYADWTRALDRAIALRPDRIVLHLVRTLVPIEERADTQPMRALIEAEPAAKAETDFRLLAAFFERDYIAIADALAELGDRQYGSDWARFSREFGGGLLARMTGDKGAARRAFAAARVKQLALVEAQPSYGPAASMLGLIEAGLGNKAEALRMGRRAVELLPLDKDSIRGPYMIAHLAIIAAWVGEKDLALEQMQLFEKLTPAGFHYGRLKLDPMWDPLRGDPRFEAIVASHAPAGAVAR